LLGFGLEFSIFGRKVSLKAEFNTMFTSKRKEKLAKLARESYVPEKPVYTFGGPTVPPASESFKRLNAALDRVDQIPDLELH
jgi:hypothetical protein